MKVGKFGATCLRINNKEVIFLGLLGLQTGVKYEIMLFSSKISQIRKRIELWPPIQQPWRRSDKVEWYLVP